MPNLFLIELKLPLILLCGLLGIIASWLFLFIIKYLPQRLYQSWQDKSLQVLNLDCAPSSLIKIDTTVIHKKIFIISTSIIFMLCAIIATSQLLLAAYLVVTAIIIVLIVIDYKTMLLPDELTIPLIWCGLLFNINGLISGSLANSVYGAVIGYLSLWLVFWGFKFLTHKDGMGYGDFKLLAASLAILGIQYLVPMLLISSFLGIIYFILMIIWNKTHKNPINFKAGGQIPFGPYLGIATLLLLFWGNNIISFLQL
jgi:prepilin signal peptidase PulO-like enzyme (type II secretory pathway)